VTRITSRQDSRWCTSPPEGASDADLKTGGARRECVADPLLVEFVVHDLEVKAVVLADTERVR
jgi:hypothetical protein